MTSTPQEIRSWFELVAKCAGASDIVRVPDQQLKLWQIVRASTAAPTFFPTADVDNLGDSAGRKNDDLKSYQMNNGASHYAIS